MCIRDRQYLAACWGNQASLLYQLFQRNIPRVADHCLALSEESLQLSCFNGLIRQMHSLVQGEVKTTFLLCELLPEEWQGYCIVTIALSSFGVGDREFPFELCNVAPKETLQECNKKLAGIIPCLLYTSPSPQDRTRSRMPSSA